MYLNELAPSPFGDPPPPNVNPTPARAVMRVSTSPQPNFNDVRFDEGTILARGRTQIDTKRLENSLRSTQKELEPNWTHRIWIDPWKVMPTVELTVDLVRVSDATLGPRGANSLRTIQFVREYMEKIRQQPDSIGTLGNALEITSTAAIESEFDVSLTPLFTAAKVPLPSAMSPKEVATHFLIAYAVFSARDLAKFVVPEDVIALSDFVFDHAELTAEHRDKIAAIARHLVALVSRVAAKATVRLDGHTDSRGTEKYNESLGERRAKNVQQALTDALDKLTPRVTSGVSIGVKSFGKTAPAIKAPRNNAEHARNRRVVVTISPVPSKRPQLNNLDAVLKRGLDLLKKRNSVGVTMDDGTARRIECWLRKLGTKGIDSRFVDAQTVLSNYNTGKPNPAFIWLKDQLLNSVEYGTAVADRRFLEHLAKRDEDIMTAMAKTQQIKELQGGATTNGIIAVGNWIADRGKDPNSIYSCY